MCKRKFQQLLAINPELQFTKNEFLDFFNNHVNICVLDEKEKRKFMSWQEFQKKKVMKKPQFCTPKNTP